MVRKEGQNCRNLRFKIHPTPEQERRLDDTPEYCRLIWNHLLSIQVDLYERFGLSVKRSSLEKHLKNLDYPIHSSVRLDVFQRLCFVFDKFFDDIKNGRLKNTKRKKVKFVKRKDVPCGNNSSGFIKYDGILPKGHPKFKSKEDLSSFRYKQHGNGWYLDGNWLYLSKITNKSNPIKINIDRLSDGELKTCTLKKEGIQWFAYLTVELPDNPTPSTPENAVGIDLGLKSFITTSDDDFVEPPKILRKAEKRLAKEQQKLSRMEFRSRNYNKQKQLVNRIHRKVAAARNHFSHCLSKVLVDKYNLIVFEDLKIKNLVKNNKLAKSISDVGWNKLVQHTVYKVAEKGKIVDKVNPNNTTQVCFHCGTKRKEKLKLEDRTFYCGNCGLEIGRDLNAAVNILTKSSYYNPSMMHTVGLAGINGCGDGTSTTGHGISSQVPSMNQQMLTPSKVEALMVQ
ncbi:transposase [Methanohalobium sp.]|uniref:RNA-guided endonuclease InsQ/TnpB family protein n=1 Tax=Methanohalobium sp. TaxID=2837493 RepID=UPI0025FB97FA|nr:transposase [Methanohalobium sp.]